MANKKYIEENIELLRSQRDEKTPNSYREALAKTLLFIKSKCDRSGQNICTLKNRDIAHAVFGSVKEDTKVKRIIQDLKRSDYISVEGDALDRQIKMLKELDF
ncbi:MAG: hypothetical protein JXR62_06015 [Bacilli bacterium]|nr:hypothetical protein [Bacilli bacterium]